MSNDGKLKEIIDQIECFSEKCGKAEYTDTGEAWELFTDIQSTLTKIVYATKVRSRNDRRAKKFITDVRQRELAAQGIDQSRREQK